jgi:putative membrane protein
MGVVVERAWPRWSMLGAFLVLALAMAVDPPGGRQNWVMGNIPTLVALAVVAWTWVRLPLSTASYALLFGFLTLHEIGVSFGYRVPLDLVEADRNQYDRVVHVAFGLLLTPVMRDALVRSGKADGRWADFLAVSLLLAAAALYEVTEWVGAELFWPGPAEAFLGFQGDALDATKDMALALAASLAGLALLHLVRWARSGRTRGRTAPQSIR